MLEGMLHTVEEKLVRKYLIYTLQDFDDDFIPLRQMEMTVKVWEQR